MITSKITKLGLAVVVLSLGILAACSSGDNVASSFSETNTGKPVEQLGPLAELDTSLISKYVSEGGLKCISRAKSVVEEDGVVDPDDDFIFVRDKCGSHRDIYLYINARAQVVDVKGNPVAGATVYERRCSYEDKSCLHVTDKEGYFYMDSVNFLTFWENDAERAVNNPKYAYFKDFQELRLRAFSADYSFGAYIRSSFANASVVVIDGKLVAELEKIVVAEPVYATKVYLDSLYVASDESDNENDKQIIDRWNENIKGSIENGEDICAELKTEDYSLTDIYSCNRVTEEDRKNGYMTIYGLPEGTYDIVIDGTFYGFTPLVIKP